jgi:hypothetical protein
MAPSVGLETTTMTTGAATKKTITAKGGGDMFREWTRNEFPEHGDIQKLAKPVTVPEIFKSQPKEEAICFASGPGMNSPSMATFKNR